MNTFDKIYKLVEQIPRGKVATYGDIARGIGLNNPRVVGYALHVNKDPENVDCHRVVNAKGELAKGYAFGGPGIQKQLLTQEGVKFNEEKVILEKYRFKFN